MMISHFSIEGKEYTISEKSDFLKNKQKQTLDVPSLTIGAIISGICIAVVFFWNGGIFRIISTAN